MTASYVGANAQQSRRLRFRGVQPFGNDPSKGCAIQPSIGAFQLESSNSPVSEFFTPSPNAGGIETFILLIPIIELCWHMICVDVCRSLRTLKGSPNAHSDTGIRSHGIFDG